jgi:hypothetical protein
VWGSSKPNAPTAKRQRRIRRSATGLRATVGATVRRIRARGDERPSRSSSASDDRFPPGGRGQAHSPSVLAGSAPPRPGRAAWAGGVVSKVDPQACERLPCSSAASQRWAVAPDGLQAFTRCVGGRPRRRWGRARRRKIPTSGRSMGVGEGCELIRSIRRQTGGPSRTLKITTAML